MFYRCTTCGKTRLTKGKFHTCDQCGKLFCKASTYSVYSHSQPPEQIGRISVGGYSKSSVRGNPANHCGTESINNEGATHLCQADARRK